MVIRWMDDWMNDGSISRWNDRWINGFMNGESMNGWLNEWLIN